MSWAAGPTHLSSCLPSETSASAGATAAMAAQPLWTACLWAEAAYLLFELPLLRSYASWGAELSPSNLWWSIGN